jgi:hypothetical protein
MNTSTTRPRHKCLLRGALGLHSFDRQSSLQYLSFVTMSINKFTSSASSQGNSSQCLFQSSSTTTSSNSCTTPSSSHNQQLPVQPPQRRPQHSGKKSQYQQRVRFTLFLKILLTRLEKEGHHKLLDRARETVSHCSRRNKMGDPDYAELVESLEVRLRTLVGEVHWIRTHYYMRHYIHDVAPTRKKKTQNKSKSHAAAPFQVLQASMSGLG